MKKYAEWHIYHKTRTISGRGFSFWTNDIYLSAYIPIIPPAVCADLTNNSSIKNCHELIK
jgi:hypothetical protein